MKKIFFAALLCVCGFLHGKVVPAAVFSDNMVLQRDRNVPVWGVADPGEDVTVKFAGQSVSAKADAQGNWQTVLAPMKADSKGRAMVISGKNNHVTVSNILVGEVWLCSGQSNMEMPMWTSRPRWRAADGKRYDFGDGCIAASNPGFGSMQIHNFMEKQTVFAYNNFFRPLKDIGIGNSSSGQPDWTFSNSSKNYKKALLKVYAEFE